MPNAPKKPCLKCHRNLTTKKYCETCAPKMEKKKKEKTRQYDQWRGSPASRGYDGDWVKVRRRKLDQNPLCECPRCTELGLIKKAGVVHHIESVEDFPELRLSMGNLMSVTFKCHEVMHGRQSFREKGTPPY